MVVLVLITNCHVSENSNIGPHSAQMIINEKAMIEAPGRPAARVTTVDIRSKRLACVWGILFFEFVVGFVPLVFIAYEFSLPCLQVDKIKTN